MTIVGAYEETDLTKARDFRERRWLALGLLCVAQFVVVLDASIVNVALPSIGTALSFSQENLSWVVNAYVLTFGGFLLLGGRLADLPTSALRAIVSDYQPALRTHAPREAQLAVRSPYSSLTCASTAATDSLASPNSSAVFSL